MTARVMTRRVDDDGYHERIEMHVDCADRDVAAWTCTTHTKFPEWAGTHLRFVLDPAGARETRLRFHHDGLVPALACAGACTRGWDHYLASLAAYAAGQGASPWGTPTWRPAATA
jgi:hypothetical protein